MHISFVVISQSDDKNDNPKRKENEREMTIKLSVCIASTKYRHTNTSASLHTSLLSVCVHASVCLSVGLSLCACVKCVLCQKLSPCFFVTNCIVPIYLINSSLFNLFGSSFRFLTAGKLAGGFVLLPPPPLPNTESEATTTVSVKFEVVNFWPSTSFAVALADTGMTLASNRNSQFNQNNKKEISNKGLPVDAS